MSRLLDEALDHMDAGLRAAAVERLHLALTNAMHLTTDLGHDHAETERLAEELTAELTVARNTLDAIRQAEA